MSALLNRRTFDDYYAHMRPYATSIAHARSRGQTHPYLSERDLLQEGLIALWKVWQKHHRRKPWDDLCRIGTRAILCDVLNEIKRAGSYHEGAAVRISLDEPIPQRHGTTTLAEILPGEGVQDLMLEFAMREADAVLTETDRHIYRELLAPSARTVLAFRTAWSRRLDVPALAESLRLPRREVRRRLDRVRAVVYQVVSANGYNSVDGDQPQQGAQMKDSVMERPEGPDFSPPDMPPPAVEEAKEVADVKVKKEKAVKVKKEKAVKVKKEKAVKALRGLAAKLPIKPGDVVRYIGGSRVDGLPMGKQGTVLRIGVFVRFGLAGENQGGKLVTPNALDVV